MEPSRTVGQRVAVPRERQEVQMVRRPNSHALSGFDERMAPGDCLGLPADDRGQTASMYMGLGTPAGEVQQRGHQVNQRGDLLPNDLPGRRELRPAKEHRDADGLLVRAAFLHQPEAPEIVAVIRCEYHDRILRKAGVIQGPQHGPKGIIGPCP